MNALHILLDGATVETLDEVHAAVGAAEGVDSDVYGANLDALYDVLTEPGPTQVEVVRVGALRDHLGPDGFGALWDCLADAAADNPELVIIWRGGAPA